MKESMKGWKTKYGSVALIAGQVLMGSADVAPEPSVSVWMSFIGKILTGVGGGMTAWGLGHKLEKNKVTINTSNTSPVELIPLPKITKE